MASSNFGAGSLGGWYDPSYNYATNELFLNQGSFGFIQNQSTAPVSFTIVGTVPQGTNVYTIAPGFLGASVVSPIATNLNTIPFPGISDVNAATNDLCYLWFDNVQGYSIYTYFNQADATSNFGAGSLGGWYDPSYNYATNDMTVSVGQTFFLYRAGGPVSYWTNSFVVQ